ncbi:phosphatidylglycerophosphatase A [Weissella coleopterorum]|uniref:Phosphatidylglycerophosphatase A n=1 Tax=Weissella coleopterorum TaxID=2714949 RepID=A0A6G8AYV7_9LACO|nr:phosphatidylglycerophosphatase A [Weissella coleopterorum]QIL50145.1 phosphatidylglycerophosphatase A [Weissella coleopterorum]
MSKENLEYISKEFMKRHISIADIAYEVFKSQIDYVENLKISDANIAVSKVLSKTEVQNALMVAINLDNLANKNMLDGPLQEAVHSDKGTFGIDEVIALSTSGLYGSIATTNYGYLDKIKPGIIGRLNDLQRETGFVTTFLDDMVAAIISSAEGKIAHNTEESDTVYVEMMVKR